MRNTLLACSLLLPFGSAWALELNITPGQLEAELQTISSAATSLYLKGEMDARDLGVLNLVPDNIRILDMQQCRILPYEGEVTAFPGRSTFAADELPDHLLFGCSFEKLALPADITSMGEGVCADAPNLASLIIAPGTTMISDYAFFGCPNLTSISIPSSVTKIGKSSFANLPQLVSLNLASTSVTAIPDRCFAGDSSLVAVTLPSSVTYIGSEIIKDSAVTSISLPNLMQAAPFALAGAPALTEVTLNPNADYTIGLLMADSHLTKVSGAPSDVPELFVAVAPEADVASIVRNAESVGRYAFAHTTLSELVLPAGLSYLDRGVMAYSAGLNRIDASQLEDAIPGAHAEAFKGIEPAQVKLYVQDDYLDEWRADDVWGQFQILPISSGISDTATDNSEIDIRLAGSRLSVKALSPISDVNVWLTDGTHIFSASPQDITFDANLPLPEGQSIIIISVKAAEESRSTTFLVK